MPPIDELTVTKKLPDIANSSKLKHATTLDWVGMGHIALPLRLQSADGIEQTVNAKVSTFVNLNDTTKRGIHMSRLYLLLNKFAQAEAITSENLSKLLTEQLQSHIDISDKVLLEFQFEYLIKQPALKSHYSGWKSYPITVGAQLENGEIVLELAVKVPYSSTCPCSAALARQLIAEKFAADHSNSQDISISSVVEWINSENGTYATPHSQRSQASIKVKLGARCTHLPIEGLISLVESTLKTAVQTAVKREDEQEFARLNGQNLMFCEDAARALKSSLVANETYEDFWLKIEHFESLHAHDAICITTKGVKDGYCANQGIT